MKFEKLLLQHGAAGLLTAAAYQVLAGCDFAEALALVSTYITILIAIVQADIWIQQERKEKRHGKYERGEGGSAGHKEDKVSVKAG